MESIQKIMKSLLGKIFLTKTSFFGLDKQRVVLFVSPSMKLYKIISSPQSLKNKVPFEENKIISTEQIKQWAENNNFQISFDATIPNLRNRLFTEFGDVIVENDEEKRSHKGGIDLIMTEVQNSNLPDSIKEWAKDNPEKFKQNIDRVQKLLRD
jgi:hypothetical protein